VEGETFTAEVVARLQLADEREILAQLSGELDKRHHLINAQSIMRVDGQLLSRYRFRHILFQKYLYGSLDEVERVHLHEQVGTALERLFEAQGDPAAIAPQLARHFLEARITEKAIHYLHQAGDRAVQMSAYREGMVHLNKGLELLMTLPDTPERARQELALQLSLGLAWMGDIPSPEWRNAYTRARELCHQIGNTYQLCRITGELSILHYVRAEYAEARALAEEALDLAQQDEEPLLILLSHWHLGFILFGSGEFIAARDHLKQVITFYEPQRHHDLLVIMRGSDAGVSAMGFDTCCLWCLGYPDQALERSRESLALASEQGHAFSSADVLCFAGCLFNVMQRNMATLKEHAEELMRLSREIGFLTWFGVGTCYWGEALARLGQIQEGIAQIRKGIALRRSRPTLCNMSGILGALAEAQAMGGDLEEGLATLVEAFAFVEESGERYYEAELYRLQGELLLKQGNHVEAEASFHKAIEVARRQQAKSWELRAAISLARLWQQQGKMDEAHRLLEPIYAWFTEGFDTPDLRKAREILAAGD
jgi:predicted ATPase